MTTYLLSCVYVIFLAFHAGYAHFVMKKGLVNLELGPIQKPVTILGLLLLLNGFSMTAFFLGGTSWLQFNIVFHLVLTVDEIIRTAKAKKRWPFIINHVGFALALALSHPEAMWIIAD